MKRKLDRPLSKWWWFTVLPALFPLGWLAIQLWAKSQPLTIEILFGKGELLLACCAFGAAGIGELIGSGRRRLGRKLALGGCCVLIVLCSINAYADIAQWVQRCEDYNVKFIGWGSACWCLFSIICGGSSLYLGEQK